MTPKFYPQVVQEPSAAGERQTEKHLYNYNKSSSEERCTVLCKPQQEILEQVGGRRIIRKGF